ncbi:dTDP-glucose 4,6-dehydratase [bacterium]|nr:dTDP-glucose 4,6-dehydratase [bacterium]
MRLLVTGGCGFIGSAFLRAALSRSSVERVVNLDVLSYSGRRENQSELEREARYRLVVGDIADAALVARVFQEEKIDHVAHFAAESHVDRSLFAAQAFVHTNVLGTLVLLEAARGAREKGRFERFLHVSTDEVYGDLGDTGDVFRETTPLSPRNPYSASKAGADLLALSYVKTHGLPLVVTRSSNNYGPRQFPEKLMPLVVTNALMDRQVPVYGDGKNVRDWLFVEDNAQGIFAAMERGRPGEVYNLGGENERENLTVVRAILAALGKPESLIQFVKDRPGHDRRYALDSRRAHGELGWKPAVTFEEGLARTVAWYRANEPWWRAIRDDSFDAYYERHYGKLGLKEQPTA